MKLTTWRKVITEEMEEWGDSWKNIVATTLSDAELYDEFPDPEGIVGGKFALPDLPNYTWTQTRVYFLTAEDLVVVIPLLRLFPGIHVIASLKFIELPGYRSKGEIE